MYTGQDYAVQATDSKYATIKYSECDCQGFVEKVLKDLGVRDENGKPYNWRGSNAMWRQAVSWKGTIQEAYEKFGDIPLGALAFVVKDDGGEKERGYHDGLKNATHVGIYVGFGQVRHSTRTRAQDGVGYNLLQNGNWNNIGLLKCLDYSGVDKTTNDVDNNIIARLKAIIHELAELLADLEV